MHEHCAAASMNSSTKKLNSLKRITQGETLPKLNFRLMGQIPSHCSKVSPFITSSVQAETTAPVFDQHPGASSVLPRWPASQMSSVNRLHAELKWNLRTPARVLLGFLYEKNPFKNEINQSSYTVYECISYDKMFLSDFLGRFLW